MAIINAQRNQIIRNAVMQRPADIVDVTANLWEKLASQLISIIGEGGFQSLYQRSIHLTRVNYSWIAPGNSPQHADSRFTDLKISLESEDPAQASEASIALLVTFIDILALLIGELLTTSILRSAWGDDALDSAAKELE